MAEPLAVTSQAAPEPPRAVLSRVQVLKIRSDFLRVARGRRVVTEGFVLQAAPQPASLSQSASTIRVGFTCSKKVGNAVARNRAKRRLREIARIILPSYGTPGFDYVLIGRAEQTAQQDFVEMQAALQRALAKLHGASK